METYFAHCRWTRTVCTVYAVAGKSSARRKLLVLSTLQLVYAAAGTGSGRRTIMVSSMLQLMKTSISERKCINNVSQADIIYADTYRLVQKEQSQNQRSQRLKRIDGQM